MIKDGELDQGRTVDSLNVVPRMPDETYRTAKTTLRSRGTEKIQISLYKQGGAQPESKATVPLATLQISLSLLPEQIKAALARDGIDLMELIILFEKNIPKGELITVENKHDKIVVSVE